MTTAPQRTIQTRIGRRVYLSAAYRDSRGLMKGHNFILEASVRGPVHSDSGMILSIQELDAMIKSVGHKYDHQYLNELPEFHNITVSTELLAQSCFQQLNEKIGQLPGLTLDKIRLYESDDYWVDVGQHLSPEIDT